MKTFFLKAGKGLFWIESFLCLFSGLAFAGGDEFASMDNLPGRFPPLGMPAPPIPGLDGRYLGTEQTLRIDGKSTPVIRCKSGYNSVLLFPGRKVLKVLTDRYWAGIAGQTSREGVVAIEPPAPFPAPFPGDSISKTNLVVVFADGVSIFLLKTVDSDKPFMARTVVRLVDDRKVSVRSKKAGRDPEDK